MTDNEDGLAGGQESSFDIGDKLDTFALDVALDSSPIESGVSDDDIAGSAAPGRSDVGEITAKAQRLLHSYVADVRRRRRDINRDEPEVTHHGLGSSFFGGVDADKTDETSTSDDTSAETRSDGRSARSLQSTPQPYSTRQGHIIMTKKVPVSPQPRSYRTKAMSQVVSLWSNMSTIERRALMAELDLTEARLAQRDLDALAEDSLRRIVALESIVGDTSTASAPASIVDREPVPPTVPALPVDDFGGDDSETAPDVDKTEPDDGDDGEIDLGEVAAGAAAEVARHNTGDDDDDEPDIEAQMEMSGVESADIDAGGGH